MSLVAFRGSLVFTTLKLTTSTVLIRSIDAETAFDNRRWLGHGRTDFNKVSVRVVDVDLFRTIRTGFWTVSNFYSKVIDCGQSVFEIVDRESEVVSPRNTSDLAIAPSREAS